MSNLVEMMALLAKEAGAAILEVYKGDDFGVETKEDKSPLTRADLAAHKHIVSGLKLHAPEIPILSEEEADIPWEVRRCWDRYFLVDPLDGTKEFISRNGEFTVNIALVENGVPVKGVVYVPVQDVLYLGDQTIGLAAVEDRKGRRDISTREVRQEAPLVLVASRRHGNEALQKCLQLLERKFGQLETTNMGSSIKLCLVAEGSADFYPRLAPTSEWDTAAAQAVVEAAGGCVLNRERKLLRYNTKESLLNPDFFVIGDTNFDWHSILEEV